MTNETVMVFPDGYLEDRAKDPAQVFINNLRILRSIDRWELNDAGIFPESWEDFRDNPAAEIMRWDDKKIAALWSIIKARGGG